MQKKEEKNKVGRPKLADEKTKKSSLIIIGVAIAAVLALFLGSVFALSNTNLATLQGALNISECEMNIQNIKETSAKLKWSCSKGKIKAYSVFAATEEGKIGLILPFSTRITSKKNGNVLVQKLSPGTEYVVRAITSDNKFINSEPFTTPGDAKIKIVGKSITSNTMTIGWDSKSLKSSAKKITLYPVTEVSEGEQPKAIGSKIAFTKTGAVTFKKLEPETEYQACVQLRNDIIECDTFTTKDQYNVTSQALLNSVTVTWGAKTAKLQKIEIYAADENYEPIQLIKTKEYSKPKKAGVYTATKLTHGVHYVVKAIFDDGKEVVKGKKVLSSHQVFVTSSDKDLVISWADSKTKVTSVSVTLLDEEDEALDEYFDDEEALEEFIEDEDESLEEFFEEEEESIEEFYEEEEALQEILNETYDTPKASGVVRVSNLEQDTYYRVLVKYEDGKEVAKIVKTLYAYNVLVLPTSKTATVSWANTSSGVTSVILEKINEENPERDDSEMVDSVDYSKPTKIGLKTFKNLEPRTAYSITVSYESGETVTEEFRTLPEIKIEEDSSLYKFLGLLKSVIIK